mmetsp:Transcript_9942/g.11340  ORF Transcript_9942/g.11340 Transcript_9942/m.11340 type:complete len:251 (+) Transcript_9942:56-808(+)
MMKHHCRSKNNTQPSAPISFLSKFFNDSSSSNHSSSNRKTNDIDENDVNESRGNHHTTITCTTLDRLLSKVGNKAKISMASSSLISSSLSPSFKLRAQSSTTTTIEEGPVLKPRKLRFKQLKQQHKPFSSSSSSSIPFPKQHQQQHKRIRSRSPENNEQEQQKNCHYLDHHHSLASISYHSLQKEYENDTLRMLERIQNSRSFESDGDDVDGDENSAVPNIELEVMATTNDGIPLQEDDEKEQDIFELDL